MGLACARCSSPSCCASPAARARRTGAGRRARSPVRRLRREASWPALRAAWDARPKGYVPRTRHLRPDGTPRYTNRLFLETSPYLLQHAHNPVDWYPWGDEAFDDRAARSAGRCCSRVGYSTCHWCHVMEEESFEDEEIARYLNEHYVAIKVDREERPDVDAIYMNAVQALTGGGGWPMTVWLTPERAAVLRRHVLPAARRRPRRRASGSSTLLAAARGRRTTSEPRARRPRRPASLGGADAREPRRAPAPARAARRRRARRAAAARIARRFDPTHGGIARRAEVPAQPAGRASCCATTAAPATPTRSRMATRDARADGARAASTTTSAAASTATRPTRAGSCRTSRRCSTTTRSSRWPTSRRYQATGRADFADVAREILALRRARHDGARAAASTRRPTPTARRPTASARRAGSSPGRRPRSRPCSAPTRRALVARVLRRRRRRATSRAGASSTRRGRSTRSRAELGRRRRTRCAHARRRRASGSTPRARKRPPPLRDDKILAAWNGLMISAFARAALVLGEPALRRAARRARADFVLDRDARATAACCAAAQDGRAGSAGYLDDYAFLIAGLLDLYEATGEPRWLARGDRARRRRSTRTSRTRTAAASS